MVSEFPPFASVDVVASVAWPRELGHITHFIDMGGSRRPVTVRARGEWRTASGDWWHRHGIELWQFDERGRLVAEEAESRLEPIPGYDRRSFDRRAGAESPAAGQEK